MSDKFQLAIQGPSGNITATGPIVDSIQEAEERAVEINPERVARKKKPYTWVCRLRYWRKIENLQLENYVSHPIPRA